MSIKRLSILVCFVILFSTAGNFLSAAIPASERAALIAFYNATNGDTWEDNRGWKQAPLEADGFATIGSEDSWIGVNVDYDTVNSLRFYWIPMSGYIPEDIGALPNLTELVLHNGTLSGSLPAALFSLTKLTTLDLSNNQFSGPIPNEFGRLTKLTQLNLGYNQFTGPIPESFSRLTLMWDLDLNDNYLSGEIPRSLGNLTSLRYLHLGGNALVGRIPVEFMNFTHMAIMSLSPNAIYPETDALLAYLENVVVGNWKGSLTVAPDNLSARLASSSSVLVSWERINYSSDDGAYKVYYSPTAQEPWTYAGRTISKRRTFFTVTGLTAGQDYYFAVKTRTEKTDRNDNVNESQLSAPVYVSLLNPAVEKAAPFGSFDTPLNGSVAAGSIPVTGWALDDNGVEKLKIYLQENGTQIYLGDATLVEGARPDVVAAYPDLPANQLAGWGYMLLTNTLPNGGNGIFVLEAVAYDFTGKSTSLGTRTINSDNTTSVKPFGALDTPGQGATISGSRFIQWGWALTAQPNAIPADGSTITVWVDGRRLGNPAYNIYRQDIADLFPGYANTNGATGYYILNTESFSNGVHTIWWNVRDDAGNVDGIGSRYFTVYNEGSYWRQGQSSVRADQGGNKSNIVSRNRGRLKRGFAVEGREGEFPVVAVPVKVLKGFDENLEPEIMFPGRDGIIRLYVRSMGRLEIRSAPGAVFLGHLPIGSSLDEQEETFYWQVPVGFAGEHKLSFRQVDGSLQKIVVKID